MTIARPWKAAQAVALITLVALTGCVEPTKIPPLTGVTPTPKEDVQEGDPISVSFTEPEDGAIIQTEGFEADIVAELAIEGLDLGDGKDSITILLDGKEVGRVTKGTSYTFAAVPLGAHTLGAEAVDAEGELIGGKGGRASVSVTVLQSDTGDDGGGTGASCKNDGDCAYLVEGLPCQVARCTDGECVAQDAEDGDACDDGDGCTDGDACDAGECVGAEADCDDGNDCTTDKCDKKKGCLNTPNSKACDDGDPCTLGDICTQGLCKAQGALGCDDGDACTDDACDPKTGGCTNVLADIDCDDQNQCTLDTCNPETGACDHLPLETGCDDGNLCTDDACDAETGSCKNTPIELACDDGDACTNDGCDPLTGECTSAPAPLDCPDGDYCTDISCDPATGDCVYEPADINCDDSDPCTKDSCNPDTGDCKHEAIAVSCDDDNVCTKDTCDEASPDGCKHEPAPGSCDDGDTCTYDDGCKDGACTGTLIDCGDGDPCTTDTCAEGSCSNDPTAGACDDGNACTQDDTCAEGACAGTAVDCSDDEVCTDDSCVPATGCKHVANKAACDDGDACTTGDVCKDGKCAKGTAKVCNDNNVCTSDACDSLTGDCVHQPVEGACSDGDACTEGDVCDAGTCVPGPVKDCDDDNPCTTETCSGGGCSYSYNSAPCDDDDPCTAGDKCQGGFCAPGADLQCDDGDPCNGAEVCIPAEGGCGLLAPAPKCGDGNTDLLCDEVCDDGDEESGDGCNASCTSDESCGNDFEDPGEQCDDGNKDPGDGCDEDCQLELPECAIDDDCDDESVCTGVETCVAGACVSGATLECKDGIPCTKDGCDAVAGCTFTPNHAACTDGIGCTSDTCDPVAGCTFTPVDTACDDLIPCTADSCVTGFGCKHVADHAVCEDGKPCTVNTCSPSNGCVTTAAVPGAPCDDGDPCTTGDACAGTSCTPGGPKDCDDGIPCTSDACGIGGECLHAPAHEVCDDGDPCTDDVCGAVGCESAAASGGPCDDGDECTLNDVCSAGFCVGGEPNPVCAASACTLSGVASDSVDCTLRIARAAVDEPVPTGLEMTLEYDPAVAKLDNFYTEFCISGTCYPVPATGPGSTPLPSGHSVSIAPLKVADWAGTGSVIVVNSGNPAAPLSNAYVDGDGTVVGEPKFLVARFVLLADVSAEEPSPVDILGPLATDADANSLMADVILGIITTWFGP